ncbi:GrpE-domain-containing protein [Aspergillus heteromorphus CBS 117.55]|uniref:GrpE protein homolog n=1 Tax=Aspergillus heteromorphus CBS 117.55 TaxID=1448321 RepID=A0A317VNI4_9EURO|nr:GrpE-domain-containing protein [Aspergillus heteromorphus CBS 117.55]PWY74412.1 GrpE-domain-containing protein [Aspergillus heteromorphus CBS 117.55]
MFQRTFLRQAQRSLLSVRSTSATTSALRTSQLSQSVRPIARQSAYRLYSTENKPENGEKKENEAKEAEAEDPVRKELEEKNKEVVDLKDKYRRSVADFLNLQERTKREMDNSRNFAIQRFAADLLESIDNFDRALLAVPKDKLSAPQTEENKDLLELVSGLKMTQNILLNTLKKHGLERFDPSEPTEDGKTQKFDPNVHEATFMAKVEGKEDGDIMYTQSTGFRLNGRVLRAAKVGVVKNT